MLNKKNDLLLNYKVERSNELNILTPKGWNLTEVRLLAIYQAKINARNPNSRVVKFPLETFCEIMEIKRLNITQMKETVRSLLSKPVFLPNGKNGFIGIPLFIECEVLQDDNNGEWLVKIECHQKALPYMFEMKKNYFTYELWNALSLSSVNQVRMYEILKQYEKIGERTITIEELKRMLGIESKQYKLFKDFRVRVLESCQKALEEHTDIKYTFEPVKRGRKIYALRFIITKNKNFKDDLRLKEFIKPEDLSDIMEEPPQAIEEPRTSVIGNTVEPLPIQSELEKLYIKTEKSYSMEQLEILVDLAREISQSPGGYVRSIYWQIRARNVQVRNIFSYTLAIIQNELRRPVAQPQTQTQTEPQDWDNPSYDFNEFLEQIYNQM